MKPPKQILPTIVIAQFLCASLWFASNGVMDDLILEFKLEPSALAHLTSAVQLGFIAGTLTFALFTLSDRFSPSRIFVLCALLGAASNAGIMLSGNGWASLIALRFITGFAFAGLYPVGMKIAADYYEKGLGPALGLLVGALVLGTALPHLLKDLTSGMNWQAVVITTSTVAVLGGFSVWLLVPDGPHRRKSGRFDLSALVRVFHNKSFRSAAFGYFGHMWELYAFWAFVPVMLATFEAPGDYLNVSLISFVVIAIGGVSCAVGGYVSQSAGTRRTAAIALCISGLCCMVSPVVFSLHSNLLLVAFLLLWGSTVVADSPLFSTLVAQNTDATSRGTALTIVNCIGFSITILSLQLMNALIGVMNMHYMFMILALGPVLGLVGLLRRWRLNDKR